MLLNLFLASITASLCFFFLFLVLFNNFFKIYVVKEKKKLKLVFAIPTGVPIMPEKEIIDIPIMLEKKKNRYLSTGSI